MPVSLVKMKTLEIWPKSRLMVESREAKEEAASSAPTDSTLARMTILQEKEL